MKKDDQEKLFEKLKETSKLEEDHLKKLFNAIIKYIDAKDSYGPKDQCIKTDGQKRGYFDLANCFLTKNGKQGDMCYYKWLETIINSPQENESVVLSCLKEIYTDEKNYTISFLIPL